MNWIIKNFIFIKNLNEGDMEMLLWFLLFLSEIWDFSTGVKDVPTYQMEALSGETIYLPCNISTYEGDDAVLILWYREDKGTPIYSVDIRVGGSKAAKRWSDETIFGGRAYFIYDKEPGELSIQSTQESDSGTYRCRVDFLKAQTRNSKVHLTVISPPERIVIRDETDTDRSTVVGPYNEGDMASLKCEAYGGKPTPTISWFRDGIPMITETNLVPGGRSVQGEITLGPLGREDLNSRLTCRANNHPRATPIESIVQIDMNFAPLNVRLLGAHQSLSAGRRYDLLCQSAGSRPPAVITWWQDGMRLEKTTETTSSDGNQTTSTLSISFRREDSGKYLSCRAYNHAVHAEPLEDGWRLDIQYLPETYVRLGISLDPNAIREGTDVYFDCLVSAHPAVYKVDWRHNDRPLLHNISQGVIISNHSLVLQGVTRATAGNYSCVGYNAEGDGVSPPFLLNILYAPTCMPNQPRIYGVAKQEDARIRCTVDANPPDVEFSWTFNNSAESIDVATNHITRSGTSSVVTYTPITELDYGTLLCMASNKIGRQRVPCVFHIIAAGRPDQVHNCTLNNISMTSLTVTCSDGFNGGLPQLFLLELRDTHTSEVKANITSTVPRFSIAALSPGNFYSISIYAFNSKGRSDPTNLNAAMLRMPEKQLTSEKEKPQASFLFSPVMSLTIGLTLAVMVAGLAVVLALRIPCKTSAGRRRRRKEFLNDNASRDCSPGASDKSSGGSKEIDGNESDEKNPDIIPETIESDDQMDSIRRRQQHISTIDTTSSPTRELLASTSNSPPHPITQQFSAAGMTLHASHQNAMGYCTLRNGTQPPSLATLSMNNAPHIYSNSIAQCTLPRHTPSHIWPAYSGGLTAVRHTQQQPMPASLHQFPSTINPHQQHAHVAEIVTSATSPCTLGVAVTSGIGATIALQQMSQNNQRARMCIGLGNSSSSTAGVGSVGGGGSGGNTCAGSSIGSGFSGGGGGGGLVNTGSGFSSCLSEEEVTVQTPLMMKRESTV